MVMQVTRVEEKEQVFPALETIEWTKRKLLQRTMRNSAGLPVCVQVIGKPYEDERVLRVLKEIERGIGFVAEDPCREK